MGTAIYPLFDSSGNAIAPPGISGGADAAGATGAGCDGSSGGTDTSGWLSGMGSLFSGIGTAISSGLKAANTHNVPTASGWVFNPATGQYYNALTGQAMTSTGALTSGGIFTGSNTNLIVVALVVLAAIFLMKRGG